MQIDECRREERVTQGKNYQFFGSKKIPNYRENEATE